MKARSCLAHGAALGKRKKRNKHIWNNVRGQMAEQEGCRSCQRITTKDSAWTGISVIGKTRA